MKQYLRCLTLQPELSTSFLEQEIQNTSGCTSLQNVIICRQNTNLWKNAPETDCVLALILHNSIIQFRNGGCHWQLPPEHMEVERWRYCRCPSSAQQRRSLLRRCSDHSRSKFQICLQNWKLQQCNRDPTLTAMLNHNAYLIQILVWLIRVRKARSWHPMALQGSLGDQY